jgi:hypothetical protein
MTEQQKYLQARFTSAAFSGELDAEDLEFLSDRQAELICGGGGFSANSFTNSFMNSTRSWHPHHHKRHHECHWGLNGTFSKHCDPRRR